MLPPRHLAFHCNALKREQGLVKVKQAKFIAGEKPAKRRKDKANEEGLKNLISGYFHGLPMEYIHGVTHRIGLNETKCSPSPLFTIFVSVFHKSLNH